MQSNWQIECWELLYLKNCFNPTESTVCYIFIIFSVSRLPCVLPCPQKRKLAENQRLPTKEMYQGWTLQRGRRKREVKLSRCSPRLPKVFSCAPFVLQNALLPAGFRQKDQTAKKASGPFDRERLLAYLEKQALEYKDREDYVPFTREKKGNATLSSGSAYEVSKVDEPELPWTKFDWSTGTCNAFNSQPFQMAATVQAQEASCSGICAPGAGVLFVCGTGRK